MRIQCGIFLGGRSGWDAWPLRGGTRKLRQCRIAPAALLKQDMSAFALRLRLGAASISYFTLTGFVTCRRHESGLTPDTKNW